MRKLFEAIDIWIIVRLTKPSRWFDRKTGMSNYDQSRFLIKLSAATGFADVAIIGSDLGSKPVVLLFIAVFGSCWAGLCLAWMRSCAKVEKAMADPYAWAGEVLKMRLVRILCTIMYPIFDANDTFTFVRHLDGSLHTIVPLVLRWYPEMLLLGLFLMAVPPNMNRKIRKRRKFRMPRLVPVRAA